MATSTNNEDNNSESLFLDNFSCYICKGILKDPVQCQTNEHYFCIECITKCLQDSKTCPTCSDELSIETLRPAPKIIANIVSQFRQPRCSFVSRGCKENVQVEELLLHQQTCGYAPVACSHEGCKETLNKRDKASHESEVCMYRPTTCDSCAEEMRYCDFEKHQCTLRKEINGIKASLDEVNTTLKQIIAKQTEIETKFEKYEKSIQTIHSPLYCPSSATIQREGVVLKGQIFVIGGHDETTGMSIEVFNWSTKTWTLVKNCLKCRRHGSFSFVYGKKIMICLGQYGYYIEYISPSENGYTSTLLPLHCNTKGVPYGSRIITFGRTIDEITLEPPYTTKTLLDRGKCYAYQRHNALSAHHIGDRIYVVYSSGSIELYDVVKNEIKALPNLQHPMKNGMATVAYRDSIIAIGGQDNYGNATNEVSMYNIHTFETKPLPGLRQARSGCAAVIMEDVVIAMGGQSSTTNGTQLKTVEYYVIGNSAWQELPSMHCERVGASACVYI